ncbi:(E)-beta-ocimene synthase, chloroplastic-like [Rutidosis leptorrhynchoides]|uniref:(E)-beta-ocimene synthase, chloroplastic-like n=1 Tax=Rutidosis leptorrhynchoides TaxID=125765 RepID=UPI003A996162
MVAKTPIDECHAAVCQRSNWSHDFIESLETDFPISRKARIKELEAKVIKTYFCNETCSLSTMNLLELVDDIERLGLGYRFQNYIKEALKNIASRKGNSVGDEDIEHSLHEVSLKFRLLREHDCNVSQEFARRFKDSHGDFFGYLETDIKGLLSLYEASYLAFEEERDLYDARYFATEHLLKLNSQDKCAFRHVNHALELPLYRRMQRVEARWYIDGYAKQKDANLLLLELAILDFNMIQASLKRDLQEVSKWWKDIGLANKLSFARDRILECFFWMVGVVFEPQYHSCRVGLTKVCSLITIIDDIYDVYGTLDELEIFTNAVQSWDITAVKHMPKYLQVTFLALYNTINEMGSKFYIPILVKEWGELCKAFLLEAKWMHSKCIPTLETYLDNAWCSASGVVLLTHGYFLIHEEISEDTIQFLKMSHDLMKWSSMIFRLCNDLGTSSAEIERGELANAISCYMLENDVCDEVAREYVQSLIDEAWMKLTKAWVTSCQGSKDCFIDMAINLARSSHCAYQYGDGHGAPDARVKDQVLSVLIKPIENLVFL